MVGTGMPSSAARPGTDHWPGGRLVSAAGRPLCWRRMPRWEIRARTCSPGNRVVRLGGRNPSAFRTPAIWLLFWPAPASSVTRARSAGKYDSWSRRPTGRTARPVVWWPPAQVDGHVDDLAVPGDVHGDVLDED